MTNRVRLPEPVAHIYKATAALEALYPGRRFTPDGHLVGSIGEVIAAEALGLTLYPMSRPGHDAYDANGDVQIKMTAGTSIAMYAICDRLVVLRVVSPEEAEIIYDGPGKLVWEKAGKKTDIAKRVDAIAKDASHVGGMEKDTGYRPGAFGRSKVKGGSAKGFPGAIGQTASIWVYAKKPVLKWAQERISFNVFDEVAQKYEAKFYAFTSPDLASQLHRGHTWKVQFDIEGGYPRIVAVLAEIIVQNAAPQN